MNNNFNEWNNLKQKIDNKKTLPFYVKERQIWYINIWINIWHETLWKWNDFRRPVLVLKKIWSLYLVIPMTTKKWNEKFQIQLSSEYFNKQSFITTTQAKFVDHKRFIKKIKTISQEDFEEIKKRLKTDWF